MNKMSLNEQAQEILRIAEQHGVEQNFFFLTTFKRYQVQLQILNDLENTIKEDGTLVTKEYVKGRKNVYSHPAISDYNRTTDSANKTVSTLMKIIISLRKDDITEETKITDNVVQNLIKNDMYLKLDSYKEILTELNVIEKSNSCNDKK